MISGLNKSVNLKELTTKKEEGESCRKMRSFLHTTTRTQLSYTKSCALLILCAAGIINVPSAEAHLASFISSEGRPSLTPRPIRGPTVPTMPFPPSSSEILRFPGLTFVGGGRSGGGGSDRKMLYLRNMNDDPSFGNVHNGVSTSGGEGGGGGAMLDYEDKPTFVPYIGPRALSSMSAYLRHLRDNLEALQSAEYTNDDFEYDDDMALQGQVADFSQLRPSSSSYDRQHTRRHVNPNPSEAYRGGGQRAISGVGSSISSSRGHQSLTDNPHTPNMRQFVEPPETFVIRRAIPNNYSPSWSYTKLGLGKRKRSSSPSQQ